MMCFWNDWNGMFGMSWKSLHVFMPSSIAFSFAVRKLLHNHQQLIDHEYGSPA
jgi:ABC-type multidrug transport system permease subunit